MVGLENSIPHLDDFKEVHSAAVVKTTRANSLCPAYMKVTAGVDVERPGIPQDAPKTSPAALANRLTPLKSSDFYP